MRLLLPLSAFPDPDKGLFVNPLRLLHNFRKPSDASEITLTGGTFRVRPS